MEKKRLNLTEEDLKELEMEKERNFQQRLKFIDAYAEWIRKTPNKVWSRQQKKFMEYSDTRK